MAFITEETCSSCGETRRQDHHTFIRNGNKCAVCCAEEASKKRRLHLASLKGLTVEERLDRIEEVLYDTDARDRLKALEAANQTYS